MYIHNIEIIKLGYLVSVYSREKKIIAIGTDICSRADPVLDQLDPDPSLGKTCTRPSGENWTRLRISIYEIRF